MTTRQPAKVWDVWSQLITDLQEVGYAKTLLSARSELGRNGKTAHRFILFPTRAAWLQSSHCSGAQRAPWNSISSAVKIESAIRALAENGYPFSGITRRAHAAIQQIEELKNGAQAESE